MQYSHAAKHDFYPGSHATRRAAVAWAKHQVPERAEERGGTEAAAEDAVLTCLVRQCLEFPYTKRQRAQRAGQGAFRGAETLRNPI